VNVGICQARLVSPDKLCPSAIRNFNNDAETDSLAQAGIIKYRQRESLEFEKPVLFSLFGLPGFFSSGISFESQPVSMLRAHAGTKRTAKQQGSYRKSS
jgi:hypothetical protein